MKYSSRILQLENSWHPQMSIKSVLLEGIICYQKCFGREEFLYITADTTLIFLQ